MPTHFLRLFAILMMSATVLPAAETPPSFDGNKSQWSGYDKFDFTCDGRPATVVVPKTPAEGKPWLWRGEFFGAFASVDEALLAKGWHVAYLNCSDTFGSPETIAHWEAFYKLLTESHGLSRRPVVYGMSRGGLYVYHWASKHPDETGFILGDAPVCDTKSWPGGKGKGDGSPHDWDLFKSVYHLTEEQAMQWKGNPIDVEILEPIAKAKIPIMHVVGDSDTAVPMNENTTILKEHYEKLGGHVELIVKKGVGHHPHSLSDPTPIVDYILKNAIVDR